MWNLLLAVTNFTAYYPIITALLAGDVITAGIIAFAAVMSVVSHLFESHKHGMNGFGCSPRVSYLLNRLDVLAVILVIGRMLWICFTSRSVLVIVGSPSLMLLLSLALICNLLSEADRGKRYYVPLHCIWHLSIFLLLDSSLKSHYRYHHS